MVVVPLKKEIKDSLTRQALPEARKILGATKGMSASSSREHTNQS